MTKVSEKCSQICWLNSGSSNSHENWSQVTPDISLISFLISLFDPILWYTFYFNFLCFTIMIINKNEMFWTKIRKRI